jgi:hypothetical protein
VIKRIAFECPIRSISDQFYILFNEYKDRMEGVKVSEQEDEISAFFKFNKETQ